MALATIAAIISAAKGIADLYTSNNAYTGQPTYVIPKSATDALNTAYYLSSQKELPGADLIKAENASKFAAGVKASQLLGNNSLTTQGTVAQQTAMAGRLNNQLGIASANNYINNMKGKMGALNKYAGYEDQRFKYNEFIPWQIDTAKSAEFEKAGWMNIMNALNNVASYQETSKMWDKYLTTMGSPKTEGVKTPDITTKLSVSKPVVTDPNAILKNPVDITSTKPGSWDRILKGINTNLVYDPISKTYVPWGERNRSFGAINSFRPSFKVNSNILSE